MDIVQLITKFSDFWMGLGASLLLPIIITILGLVFGQKFTKALMEKYNLPLETAAAIAKEVFEDDISLFTVNAKNYGNLGENMQEILRFIREQREVVQYYRESVPTPTKADVKEEG